MKKTIELSPLNHTWILDLDGTIVKHNGYKLDGYDTLLDNAEAFLKSIPETDMIVLITSRTKAVKEATEQFLSQHEIRFDYIIYSAPYGERILINDKKPSGLKTGIAINTERDTFFEVDFEISKKL